VVVTGGAGYVGSVAARELLGRRHSVTVLDSLMYGGRALLGLYGDRFRFCHADIRDADAVSGALDSADAVVHLAAIVGDPACARRPELGAPGQSGCFSATAGSVPAQACAALVFASTCSIYGRLPDYSRLATEDTALAPVSLYAESKVAVEKELLGGGHIAPPEVTVLRFATFFGLSPRPRFDLTVNEFTAELMTARKLVVFGEQFWRPYIHVREVARALALAVESRASELPGEVFNVWRHWPELSETADCGAGQPPDRRPGRRPARLPRLF
jgi:nucleoside-diphosphate-sugar epimerase